MSQTERLVRLAKGFILNKMILSGFIGGKHTSKDNIPRGCPPELAPYVREALSRLINKDRLVRAQPKTKELHVTAVPNDSSYKIANDYRQYAQLEPPLKYGVPSPAKPKPPLPMEELKKLRFRK